MTKTVDFRRETEWKAKKMIFPHYLEMTANIEYADGVYELSGWFQELETKLIALPNNRSKRIYRKIGSKWNAGRTKRPPPSSISRKK